MFAKKDFLGTGPSEVNLEYSTRSGKKLGLTVRSMLLQPYLFSESSSIKKLSCDFARVARNSDINPM